MAKQQKPNPDQKSQSMDAASQEQVAHHTTQAKKRRKVGGGTMSLNLTAMIDVTFQLLIYFIITASFSAGEGIITAKFPQGTGEKSAEEPPDRPLRIRLTSYGQAGYRISLDGIDAPPNFSALHQRLEAIQYDPSKGRSGSFKPDNPVIIKPTGRVRWTHVVNAFNAAIRAGYSNVAFAQADLDT